MTTAYDDFLASKRAIAEPVGFHMPEWGLNTTLFPFQRDIVTWALHRGRAAIFADCGLGKTRIQLEWARHVSGKTSGNVLILTPLAVAQQTAAEAEAMGLNTPVVVAREQADVPADHRGIVITNYERIHRFDPASFTGIVLDESSILKAFDGKIRAELTTFAEAIPFRLCCTATPAPNDLVELTNHAEFLDIMSGKEIVALYFTQDGNTTHNWRLKGHARADFWRWMASWSVAIRRPSDIGQDDAGFDLPSLDMVQHTVDVTRTEGTLFPVVAVTLQERQRARRESTPDRVAKCAELVNASTEPWVVWCDLNAESEALAKAIPDAVEVRGSDTVEHKEQALAGFANGTIRVLVTKPTIAGYGMNWQHCAHMAFVGLSDSYEQQYQAIRRCWRFGQTQPVTVHVITAVTEGAVVRNIERKERQAAAMMNGIVEHMKGGLMGGPKAARDVMDYREDVAAGDDWTLYLGDSVRLLADRERMPDDSIGLSVFSPPFPGMYAYTNSEADMGNVSHIDEMIEHFRFMVPGLLRVTMPGRLACVHLCQLTAMQGRDGFIGLKDYRGRVIEMFEQEGFHYAGEVTIEKNPQIQAVRAKERGLLFKSLATDSSVMRMGLADYMIYFRKDGRNPEPIRAGISEKYQNADGWITEQEWVEWASPVWHRHRAGQPGGIRETDVLNVVQARETDDERHLCPLQLGVIERAIKLWSNPGDLVFDPFNGIGSTGHEAIRLGRRYVGGELKESYWRTSQETLRRAEAAREQGSIFAAAG